MNSIYEDQESSELNHLEYLEALGINNIQIKKYGRERGLNPTPTEAQLKEVSKLASKLTFRITDQKIIPDEDGEQSFDIMSKPRVILYEGKVQKRSRNSVVQHLSRRHLFLLNDVLLVTSSQSSNSMKLGFSSDKYFVHKVLYLDNITFSDLSWTGTEDNIFTFQIASPERPYDFVAESESDKRIWLEEMEAAIFCVKLADPRVLSPGWMHEIVQGTIFSAALYGELDALKLHVQKLQGKSVDVHDELGMTPLHWAALRGHTTVVEFLLDNGAKIDNLNNGLNSALMLAASQGHDAVVLLLMSRDADIHIRNLKDRDALFMAVLYAHRSRGLSTIIQALTNHGVNINLADSSGSSPLHECATRNLARPVLLLVDNGADVNRGHSRNGLTSLHLACSVKIPDVETVRSLLDKGAYPNGKDAARRTAFDMVLTSHSTRFNGEKALAMSTENDQGLKSTVDEVASFVQDALPVLMEIVKKGGRYTEESLASLRPSFREAIDSARQYWLSQVEPEYFVEFVYARGELELNADTWITDNTSKFCLLCLDKFSLSSRRHHCRSCGTLCCDLCSSKRLLIRPPKEESPRSTSGNRKKLVESKPERVCDGCFNRLIFESWTRQQDVIRMKKELEKAEAMERLQLQKEVLNSKTGDAYNSNAKSLLIGSRMSAPSTQQLSDTSIGSSSGKISSSPKDRAIGSNHVFHDAAASLYERGEKLQNTVDRTEVLREAATDYNKMAKSLLQQQQRKHGLR